MYINDDTRRGITFVSKSSVVRSLSRVRDRDHICGGIRLQLGDRLQHALGDGALDRIDDRLFESNVVHTERVELREIELGRFRWQEGLLHLRRDRILWIARSQNLHEAAVAIRVSERAREERSWRLVRTLATSLQVVDHETQM